MRLIVSDLHYISPTIFVYYTFKNGQLIIDTSGLRYSDLKSTAAWVFKME